MINLQTTFAWLFTLFLIVSALPAAALTVRRLRHVRDHTPLTGVLALALSVGLLTLILLWEGMLNIPFRWTGIALPYLAIMGAAAILYVRSAKSQPIRTRHRLSAAQRVLIFAMLAVAAAVLFTALYYPIYRDDALAIYRPFAVEMSGTRALVPLTGADSLYRAYPMLIPAAYTVAYLASGWENDYLAKLFPVLLSLGCIPAASVLARMIGGRRAGWIASVMLTITPAFGRWASSGYVDLPMAFFYTLTAIFALRLWRSGSSFDALLAGIMLGLAAWTKNAALLGVPLLTIWVVWLWIERRITLRHVMIALAACAIIGAPWYVRNLLGAGFIVPDTAWTDQAEVSLNTLFVFVTRPENFGVTGIAILFGWIASLFRLRSPGVRLTLLFTLPFFSAWWLFVSYDPRFLLLFLPIACALAGAMLAGAWTRFAPLHHRWLRPLALIVIVFLALQSAYFSAEYKDEFLRDPLMSHEEKIALTRDTR